MDCAKLLRKFRVQEGDAVLVKARNHENKGLILPTHDENVLVLKLDTGYNAGFNVKEVKEIKLLKKKEKKTAGKEPEHKKNPALPTIAILHTGGTIASKVDYETGGVVPLFDVSDLMHMVPELEKITNIEAQTVSNIFSEDMRFSYYSKLAKEIEKELAKKEIEGIIVTHGTDTMAYTASAVSFMFEEIGKPVLFVGTQRSSDRPSSEVAMNLLCATNIIVNTDFAGIGICMHATISDDYCNILPATKTRKMHSSRRDAFKPVNTQEIALVNYKTGEIKFKELNYLRKRNIKAIAMPRMEEKVAILKSHPNLLAEEIDFYRKNKFKGLIIEGTGFGHIPINNENESNKKALQKLVESGCVIGMTTQCLFGRTNADVYSTARKLHEMGVIYCEDMLPETAFIKLAWLLGNFKKAEVLKLLAKNLRGEISERSGLTDFWLEK